MRERLSGDRPRWLCWVADEGPTLQGAAWLHLIEKLPNPVGKPEWHGYVSNLFVRPTARGRGLGSALLTAAMSECDRRVDAVILWPTPESRRLYERHGFGVRGDLFERRPGGSASGR